MFSIETKYTKYPKNSRVKKLDEGFSLLETVIALTTLGVCLAYAMPLFLYAKVNNSKSEIRTGALIVSQRVFDNIRSKSIDGLPNNDGKNNPNAVNPISIPTDTQIATRNIPPADELITSAMGRQYQTKVIYCEGLDATPAVPGPAAAADPTVCTSKYRQFKVEVFRNGTKVYDLEGNFTDFQPST